MFSVSLWTCGCLLNCLTLIPVNTRSAVIPKAFRETSGGQMFQLRPHPLSADYLATLRDLWGSLRRPELRKSQGCGALLSLDGSFTKREKEETGC